MKVTFDTNGLDRVCRPEKHPKDPRQMDFYKVQTALASGKIKGYFSETIVTLEGIENKDRIQVLGGTRVETQIRHGVDDPGGATKAKPETAASGASGSCPSRPEDRDAGAAGDRHGGRVCHPTSTSLAKGRGRPGRRRGDFGAPSAGGKRRGTRGTARGTRPPGRRVPRHHPGSRIIKNS